MAYRIYENGDVTFDYGGYSVDYIKATNELLADGSPVSYLSPCFADSEDDADLIGVFDSTTNKFVSLSGKQFNVAESEDDIEL